MSPRISTHAVVRGRIVVPGYSPDGDSVRFVPHDPSSFNRTRGLRGALVGADGSAQLRLQGIDAPELHYAGHAQCHAIEARDALLHWLGFTHVTFHANGTVRDASPKSVHAAIVAQSIDARGRAIAWLLRAHDASELSLEVSLDAHLLDRTANAFLVRHGLAYPLAYTSLAIECREHLRTIAREAREHHRGVWAHDATRAGFAVEAFDALDRELVLPKIFRRAVDYLADRDDGFHGRFRAWLLDHQDENDALVLPGSRPATLHDVIARDGDRLRMTVDPIDLTFVER